MYFFFIFLYYIQRFLDSQATDIAQRQDESNQTRKKLVELSREFKKSSTEVIPIIIILMSLYNNNVIMHG